MATYRLKRKTYSVMQQAMTGEMGLFDPAMMTGKNAAIGAGLNVGFAGLAHHQHKKAFQEAAEGGRAMVQQAKNTTSQLEKIANS